MLPRETIATADIPDGETLTLVSHGRDFIIMLGRDELMGTRMQFSEEQLAVLTLAELDALERDINDLEVRTLLSGEYDDREALVTIRSEAGGVDAADWAEMLMRMYLRYCERHGWAEEM